jgi:hypothetical protein
MSRTEHLVDVPTNVGTITYIETRRKNRPAGLRKPYEYVLPMKEAKALCAELRAGMRKRWDHKDSAEELRSQMKRTTHKEFISIITAIDPRIPIVV